MAVLAGDRQQETGCTQSLQANKGCWYSQWRQHGGSPARLQQAWQKHGLVRLDLDPREDMEWQWQYQGPAGPAYGWQMPAWQLTPRERWDVGCDGTGLAKRQQLAFTDGVHVGTYMRGQSPE